MVLLKLNNFIIMMLGNEGMYAANIFCLEAIINKIP